MTELTIPVHFGEGRTLTWTTDQVVIDDEGVGYMSARTIRLIIGTLAEIGLIEPLGDDGTEFVSRVEPADLREALRLMAIYARLNVELPRE